MPLTELNDVIGRWIRNRRAGKPMRRPAGR